MTEPKKNSNKITDALKGLFTVEKINKDDAQKQTTGTVAGKTEIKATGSASAKPDLTGTVKPTTATAGGGVSKTAQESLAAYHADQASKKQLEVLHSKTHQDLINAAYKAAEKLGIAPWVLLRAAGWGHFTEDRGKKYDGPAIDEIKTLDDAQKAALKGVLGL